ncbi:MAG: Gfo/Idh/MocA family oxidoreductase [Leptolyngbyaceae cyanobacterium CSU_1_3]|nr:Gfo/Idh/MocA family oxidoreductase [Leptolyngbyaceae cyanobacterium CSU_1_3]
MSDQTKIAVLGVGRWGIHLLRNFLENPRSQVVAVVDPHAENLAAAAKRFDLGEETLLTTDWHKAMTLDGIEGVAIATPAATHDSLITSALKAELHVLAEKPLTLNLEESVQLCRLAAQQQRQLVIDHTYLFHPAVTQGKAAIATQKLGDLRYGYAARTHLAPVRQDVDALWDLAIHDIAIFNTWLGELPCEVRANGQVWLQPGARLEAHPSDLFPQGLADVAWVTLSYPSGFQATLHLSWLNPDKQRRISIVGSQGTLIFDELASESLSIQHGQLEQQGTSFVPIAQSREVLELPPGEPLKQVCDHFLTCAQQNQPSEISSGWVGAELVQILAALSASMRQGGRSMPLQPLRRDEG